MTDWALMSAHTSPMNLAELSEELCNSPGSIKKGFPLTMRCVAPSSVRLRWGSLLIVGAAGVWTAVMVSGVRGSILGGNDTRGIGARCCWNVHEIWKGSKKTLVF